MVLNLEKKSILCDFTLWIYKDLGFLFCPSAYVISKKVKETCDDDLGLIWVYSVKVSKGDSFVEVVERKESSIVRKNGSNLLIKTVGKLDLMEVVKG